MKIATWNVNSIRARLERLVAWLQTAQPDIVCLQELKVTDEAFPHEALCSVGYQAAVFGQKTYNGVAILSREAPQDVERGMPGFADPQSRLISARVGGIRVLSAYFPNGEQVGTEKYAYKLAWMKQLRAYLACRYSPAEPLVLCGDFNVARDDRDVARPAQWAQSVLCHEAARDALEEVRLWGFVDVVRQHHPEGGIYSWWDYRMLGFPKNNGLRIDHIFATESLARRCTAAEVDREQRKGDKPSDHAPVLAVFATSADGDSD
jgi:exodeoxyribonuclease-3